MSTPFQPLPCDGGAGAGGADVEQIILCDLDAEGTLLGTALAVYEYDADGNPAGPPTFVDPATGLPYVVQGTLQPCPDAACLAPIQFCQTSTTTGPVEHPGRSYDLTLPINPGFAVQSLQVDAVSHAAGITWEVDDPDGERFRQDLTAFIEGRVPASATVTITNPNAGTPQVCGAAQPMQIHIECIRLDQNPPNLVELIYNGGQDLIQNPAYNESPPLSPPVSQGNYGFHLLARQDDPGPFPGNPPAGRVLCTNTPNVGWETNDIGRTFEIWGKDVADGQNTTPTPRGTPVQEITSDGAPPGGRSTIWQTFTAPASGNFIIRVVHGGRSAGEQHRITLDNGDTGDAQNGDLIDDVSNPPSVTSNGGPNPWTQFSQTIPLNGGSTYTLALSTNNPFSSANGGLFTDMRAYIDRPDRRATATTDDETCVVTTEETTTNTQCSFWQPQCAGGHVVGWEKVDTGETLSNAEFWSQVPAPSCCLPSPAGEGGSSSTLSNMLTSDLVCATVGGIPQNAIRVIVTDPSGGTLQEVFIGADGAPISPATWTPGPCAGDDRVTLGEVCYADPNTAGGAAHGFLVRDGDGTRHVYTLSGVEVLPFPTILICAENAYFEEILCDRGNAGHQFIRRYVGSPSVDVNDAMFDFELDGVTEYAPVGPVGRCDCDPVTTTGLCLADGTPIGVVTRRDCDSGVLTQDGWINLLTGVFTAGPPPAGAMSCSASQSVQVSGTFCDVDGTGDVVGLVLIEYHYAADGTIESVRLVNATTGATYVPVGTITTCPTGTEQPEQDLTILCDTNGAFIRDYRRDETGTIVAVSNYTLAGAAYVPVGPVVVCAAGGDSESAILCDSAAVPNRFIRTYTYTAAGAVAGFTDTTLAGAPFVPTGAVGVCATTVQTDLDFDQLVLCDANGTSFIRRFTFNSTTGAVTATANLTLAGAAFAPVGAVGLCSDCCGTVIGQGCTNTGSGRYTAIRAANGTITLIDSVSGATITAANIVACPGDDTVVTLSAQGRVVGDADAAWTPGADVTGTLTSVTLTVLSGTATVTDANGTVMAGLPAGYSATWTAEDNNTLTGPQSIDAIGGNTAVVWTQR